MHFAKVGFKAAGAGGCVVELILLDADRLLYVTIAEMEESKLAVRYYDEEPEADLWGTGADSDDEDRLGNFAGILKIEPRSVALSDEETNPVWWVSSPGRPGMLVTLSYALGLLDAGERERAIRAHLEVLSDLVAHERAARSIVDNDPGSEPRCVACVTESDIHAELLVDYIALRARELVEALALFPVNISVEDRSKF